MASSTDRNIHFSGAYAITEWYCTQSDALRHLVHPDPSCNVTFAVLLDVDTMSASFEFRIPVALKVQRSKTSLFLSIPPGAHTFLDKQCEYISKKHVEVLCGTVNDDDSILNTHPQDADLSSLYGSNGDRSFDGGEYRFDAPISVSAPETHPAESPPSYDELAPTPPPPLLPQSAEKANPPSPQPTDDQRISDLVATLFSARESTLRAQIRAETQASLASQLHDLETRVTTALQAQMDARMRELHEELRGEVAALGERLDEVPDEADDAMELKLDERVTDIGDELRSYVVEELREVEGREWEIHPFPPSKPYHTNPSHPRLSQRSVPDILHPLSPLPPQIRRHIGFPKTAIPPRRGVAKVSVPKRRTQTRPEEHEFPMGTKDGADVLLVRYLMCFGWGASARARVLAAPSRRDRL
ncbi:hypothetical protein BKA81DRAFT_379281 [Phyllosticta paracitricarpa]|uniref:Uncharacterized protein n=1 Tax=Phyllosticta citricarpa TaxID=55181 RepID=A0ABR1M635_9PEZI